MNMALQLQKLFLAAILALIAILGISLAATTAEAANNPMVVTVSLNVAKGDIVNLSHLKLVESNNSKISDDIITDLKAAEGLEAMRNLRPGMILRYTYLRERPLVRKSKPANVLFHKPGITLEQEVLVLQDGNKGDVVQVKNMKSNQIFTAEVTAENTLTVK